MSEIGELSVNRLNADASRTQNGSRDAFQRASKVFPGGTTRATIARDPFPIYAHHGEGAWLVDTDDNRYLDLNNNFTTLIHGHAFEPVVQALAEQIKKSTCFANPTISEIDLAELICDRVPSIDHIRFVNTGTEAVMFAIKAARAFTGKVKVAKFEGAYHGGYDWAEVSEDSTPDNWGDKHPASTGFYQGTPQSVLDEVVVLPLNDLGQTQEILRAHAGDLACILIDLMPSRAGLVPVQPDYLSMLREFTDQNNIVLISDEVLNFRQAYEGASARFNVTPDLVALGKIIGGGLPIGAVGGAKEIMSVFDNSGGRAQVPQGGTFSANPLSMVAGFASMRSLDRAAFTHLDSLGEYLISQVEKVIMDKGLPMSINGQASLFRLHPSKALPASYRETVMSVEQIKLMKMLCDSLYKSGVNLPRHGSGCLSTAMTINDVDHIVEAVRYFAKTI